MAATPTVLTVTRFGANPNARGSVEEADGARHLAQVVEGLAHAHEDEVLRAAGRRGAARQTSRAIRT